MDQKKEAQNGFAIKFTLDDVIDFFQNKNDPFCAPQLVGKIDDNYYVISQYSPRVMAGAYARNEALQIPDNVRELMKNLAENYQQDVNLFTGMMGNLRRKSITPAEEDSKKLFDLYSERIKMLTQLQQITEKHEAIDKLLTQAIRHQNDLNRLYGKTTRQGYISNYDVPTKRALGKK